MPLLPVELNPVGIVSDSDAMTVLAPFKSTVEPVILANPSALSRLDPKVSGYSLCISPGCGVNSLGAGALTRSPGSFLAIRLRASASITIGLMSETNKSSISSSQEP